jgi:RNA-directed DNA polymerase
VQRNSEPWQARPVKRVYIPKKGSTGKRRPLGIPMDPANCEVRQVA